MKFHKGPLTIKITTTDGPAERVIEDALFSPSRELAIHRTIYRKASDTWTVTHAPSGLHALSHIRTRAAARQLARILETSHLETLAKLADPTVKTPMPPEILEALDEARRA